tara:strand:+ start:2554 stop:2871 length:318 start_codon:yes stop_codon:yes gene_type:complete
MKTFNQFSEQIKKIPVVPYGSGKEPTPGKWSYGHHGPPIHGLPSGNRYPNDIMDDIKGREKLKKQYLNEPEVKLYFKNNPKTWRSFEPNPGKIEKLDTSKGYSYK